MKLNKFCPTGQIFFSWNLIKCMNYLSNYQNSMQTNDVILTPNYHLPILRCKIGAWTKKLILYSFCPLVILVCIWIMSWG